MNELVELIQFWKVTLEQNQYLLSFEGIATLRATIRYLEELQGLKEEKSNG